jgi:hypothetical protein
MITRGAETASGASRGEKSVTKNTSLLLLAVVQQDSDTKDKSVVNDWHRACFHVSANFSIRGG